MAMSPHVPTASAATGSLVVVCSSSYSLLHDDTHGHPLPFHPQLRFCPSSWDNFLAGTELCYDLFTGPTPVENNTMEMLGLYQGSINLDQIASCIITCEGMKERYFSVIYVQDVYFTDELVRRKFLLSLSDDEGFSNSGHHYL